MQTFKRLLPTILMLLFELTIGIMLLINGEKVTRLVFIIFGSLMLLTGLISLIVTIAGGRQNGSIGTLPLFVSIIMIAIGAFAVAASDFVLQVVSAATLVYGIMLLINGVIKLLDAFALRAATGSVNGFVLFSAVISLVFGLVIAINPFGTAVFIWTLLGIGLIVSAVLDLITLIIYGRIVKEVKQK